MEIILPLKIKPVFEERLNFALFRKDADLLMYQLSTIAQSGVEHIPHELDILLKQRRKRLKLQKHKPKNHFRQVDEVETQMSWVAECGGALDFSKLNHVVSQYNHQRFA